MLIAFCEFDTDLECSWSKLGSFAFLLVWNLKFKIGWIEYVIIDIGITPTPILLILHTHSRTQIIIYACKDSQTDTLSHPLMYSHTCVNILITATVTHVHMLKLYILVWIIVGYWCFMPNQQVQWHQGNTCMHTFIIDMHLFITAWKCSHSFTHIYSHKFWNFEKSECW